MVVVELDPRAAFVTAAATGFLGENGSTELGKDSSVG